jgi:SPP1 family predicted phage head-tail adaptor
MSRAELGVRVNPAQLNCKIQIQDFEKVKIGITTEKQWVNITENDIWCQWIGAHGRESEVGNQNVATQRATIRMRYRKGVTEKCRIIKEGDSQNPYEIKSVDDVRNQHTWLELKAERKVVG